MNTSNRLDAFMRAFFAFMCCASISGTLLHAASENIELGWATAPVDPFGPGDFVEGFGERSNGVARDLDGNLILAGIHDPSGPAPLRFAALQLIPNMSGGVDLGWATAVSGPFGPSDEDVANGVAIDLDGNSILAGTHFVPGTPAFPQFAALQLIPSGPGQVELGWATALLDPFGLSDEDRANAVTIDPSGSIILAGVSVNDFAALQLIPNMSGGVDLGWATALDEPFGPIDPLDGDGANGVAIDQDGNIILAGFHNPQGGLLPTRFAALQLMPSGPTGVVLGWATAINEPFGPTDDDRANGIAIDSNGNIILAGSHDPVGGSAGQEFAALQLIPSGANVTLGWAIALSGVFGPVGLIGDSASAVVVDANGNIILAGSHDPVGLAGQEFAALQLIPSGPTGVVLGWAIAIDEPFGPSLRDLSFGLTLDAQGDPVLAGVHNPAGLGALSRFAALQLLEVLPPELSPLFRLPFVPLAAA